MDRYRIIKKWSPVIQNLGVNNKMFIEYLSIYCENYTLKNPEGVDLLEKINNILSKTRDLKIEVVKTFYNPMCGSIQYELSNGLIVDENNEYQSDLTLDNFVELFGIDVIKDLDLEEFREYQLNKIING